MQEDWVMYGLKNWLWNLKMPHFLPALPQTVLQDINKSFQDCHLGVKMQWILPATLWNSTTMVTLMVILTLLLKSFLVIANLCLFDWVDTFHRKVCWVSLENFASNSERAYNLNPIWNKTEHAVQTTIRGKTAFSKKCIFCITL